MKNRILLFALAAFMLVACKKEDAFQRQICGVWKIKQLIHTTYENGKPSSKEIVEDAGEFILQDEAINEYNRGMIVLKDSVYCRLTSYISDPALNDPQHVPLWWGVNYNANNRLIIAQPYISGTETVQAYVLNFLKKERGNNKQSWTMVETDTEGQIVFAETFMVELSE